MDSDKEKALDEAYQKVIAISFNQAPIDQIDTFVAPDVMGFGTTVDEQIHNLKEYISVVQSQEKQAETEGLKFNFETETLYRRTSPGQDSALFVDLIKASLSSKDAVVQQFTFRLSMIMEYIDGQWKLVHLHGSMPVDTVNDPWHIDEYKRENEKLAIKVAEQTADLQQKNKELEIEAATQRVRAAAMGMQQPNDIMSVLNVIKEELGKFELDHIGTWIRIFNDNQTLTLWDISEIDLNGTLSNVNITMDLKASQSAKQHSPKWKGNDYYAMHWDGDDLQGLIDEVKELDKKSGQLFQKAVDEGRMTSYWQACAPFSKGVLGLDYAFNPPANVSPILTKMASAFDMVYQRFEDLQKAEAQVRESKIEAALERVRSRTMGMQKSTELNEVSILLYNELKKLGINKSFMNCGYMEVDEENNIQRGWMSRPDGTVMERFTLPMVGDPVLQERYNAWKNRHPLFSQTVGGEKLQSHIEFVNPQLGSDEVDEMVRNEFPETVIFYCGNFNQGYLSLISGEPLTKEEEDIFTRFTRVFQQTYTRFQDLEKAEHQAYESKVEASLERVRGMAAAMNHSDDLMQIAEFMFRELEILKINPLRYGLGMIDGEKKEAELWASTVDDGRYLDMLGTLSLTWHPMLQQAFDAWESQHEEVIYELKGKELSDYYLKIGQINPDIPHLDALQDPGTTAVQYVCFFPFKSGALYAFTNGEPGTEGRSILKRFAHVFEQAHIRYNDLQVAEHQARLIREERDRLEIALKELKAMQDQLVQQEKLASLGQLTAGIAHEIKNPLNFVNNFSEVSVELIEEAREEVKEKLTADSHQLTAILDDIEANLRKIHEHGSRADSIVKSMLEHSRGGSGKMEPTDLNLLVKEYVNLCFHGMRAGKEPINVEIDLKLDDSIDEVPLVAEDFSRVILNMTNNAFDAIRDKLTGDGGPETGYVPKLTVRTHQTEKAITIEVEDNGPGIPDEIKDKIMQPFFTTKKGTQGTGLGLSITNDIVKAHGGSLNVISPSGGGTIFTISLPI
jgi:signal transduction histidine kinase